MKLIKYTLALLTAASLTSCGDDFLNEFDKQVITSDQVKDETEKNPDKALAPYVRGLYEDWNFCAAMGGRNDIYGHTELGFYGIGMLSDAMSNDISFQTSDPFGFDRQLSYWGESYIRTGQLWTFFYTVINDANTVIGMVTDEQLDDPNADATLKASVGQALALRGISYAYLAQAYQKTYVGHEDMMGVPILLTDAEAAEAQQSRAPLRKVYARAEKDLLRAIELLDGWTRSNVNEVDMQVAQGLLSRVYLVMNRWEDAAKMANAARQGYQLMTPEEAGSYGYNDVTNKEVMWGLDTTNDNTKMFASFASWMCTGEVGYGGQVGYYRKIDQALYNNLQPGDGRLELYVKPGQTVTMEGGGSSWELSELTNIKFKAVSGWMEDVLYMRVAEMYLTEAEAYAHLNDARAASVLAEFMAQRNSQWTAPAMITPDVVYTQRRLELWGEGFGYWDCRRLKKDLVRSYEGTNEYEGYQGEDVPADGGAMVSGNWSQWTFQIPLREIQNNDSIPASAQNPMEM